MAEKKYLVVHPNLHVKCSLNGEKEEIQRVPKGTTLTIDESAAKKLESKKLIVAATTENQATSKLKLNKN